eukprot:1745947-Pyramimonas_sp.AAC.1
MELDVHGPCPNHAVVRPPQDVDSNGHQACIMLNEAYDILSSPDRGWYTEQLRQAREDFEDGFTGNQTTSHTYCSPLCSSAYALPLLPMYCLVLPNNVKTFKF